MIGFNATERDNDTAGRKLIALFVGFAYLTARQGDEGRGIYLSLIQLSYQWATFRANPPGVTSQVGYPEDFSRLIFIQFVNFYQSPAFLQGYS